MRKNPLADHTYIQKILELNSKIQDRTELHKQAGVVLQAMGSDKDFLKLVVRRNFDDPGYLSQTWSQYNIPFLYIFENEDLVMKIHFFASHPSHGTGIAAHCIHHHDNYLLTTAAILGSGYETMLFDKKIDMDEKTLRTHMRIRNHFTQREYPVHTIESWEPHIVYLPETFSATLQLWTPDKKRVTDSLRQNWVLKALKSPLRKLIQMCGMEKTFGIAVAKTFQWYPNGDHFMAIDENEYFAPTKAMVGPEIDDYSIQTVCKFIQEMKLVEPEYLMEFTNRPTVPAYYKRWIEMLLTNQAIPETYAKEEINIPSKKYLREDVLNAANS
jgi:hypothetical protein